MPEPAPPLAPRRPHTLEAHGEVRVDEFYWLADRDDPAVVEYLQAENAYTEAVLAPTLPLQERLFAEIKARVVETDVSAPVRNGAWWYWTRTIEGRQYAVHCRRHDPEGVLTVEEVLGAATADAHVAEAEPGGADPTVILDENALAGDSEYFALGVWDISHDQRLLAYATDLDGSERYRLRFRDLETGTDLDDEVLDVTYGSAWAADNRTFFYVKPDGAMRPYQVWRHRLGTPASDDVLVYEDPDERFFVAVDLTRSRRYVVIQSASKTSGDTRWIDAAHPEREPQVILPRADNFEYDATHAVWPGPADVWLIRTNRGPDGRRVEDFALYWTPVGDKTGRLEVVLGPRPGVKVDDVDAFASHLVVTEREEGLERLRILDLDSGGDEVIAQPEPVYSLLGGANPEWETGTYRFGYTSLVTPVSAIDFDLSTRQRRVVKVQPVKGYDQHEFRTERIWAEAADGARVPISLVARADVATDGTAPCLLYGYGSYEASVDPTFSVLRLNLLERGVVFAIAHVRGGGEMGRHWYDDGKLQHKTNTFTDFIACAERLVAAGWANASRLAIRGASAGGLLIGAVTNARPDLWRAVVAEVPFVDVVTTMSRPELPLTVTEWEEWGNPVDDAEAYRVMRSYSPYDNLAAGPYPAMYVTAGLNDPRVGYWEPAKWVAKLRTLRTDSHHLLLRTELGAGHQGVSGRYDVWKDEARVQAFLLTELGVEPAG